MGTTSAMYRKKVTDEQGGPHSIAHVVSCAGLNNIIISLVVVTICVATQGRGRGGGGRLRNSLFHVYRVFERCVYKCRVNVCDCTSMV